MLGEIKVILLIDKIIARDNIYRGDSVKKTRSFFVGFIVMTMTVVFPGCVSTYPKENQTDTTNSMEDVKFGEMSEIKLIRVIRRNYIERGTKRETYPDGLLFYFIIRPIKEQWTNPTIEELRDFRIDGKSYLEMTREQGIADIEPNTVIYDEESIAIDEFFTEPIEGLGHFFIEKVTICGTELPKEGVVYVKLVFGFDMETEDFEWQFKLDFKPNSMVIK
jgi:hypothetical protein